MQGEDVEDEDGKHLKITVNVMIHTLKCLALKCIITLH